ncbi:MAG: hypothetical protein ACOYJ1_10625, partial [Peptococcales bacterium]
VKPNTTYSYYAYYPETSIYYRSANSETGQLRTKKSQTSAPTKTPVVLDRGAYGFTLGYVDATDPNVNNIWISANGIEKPKGSTWGGTIDNADGIVPGTTYDTYAFYPETSTSERSPLGPKGMVTTENIATKPGSPTIDNKNNNQIVFAWNASQYFKDYTFAYRLGRSGSFTMVAGVPDNTYSFTGIYGEEYTVKVAATDNWGTIIWSDETYAVVLPDRLSLSVGKITNTTVEINTGTNPSGVYDDLTLICVDSSTQQTLGEISVVPNNVYTWQHLTPNTSYEFKSKTISYGESNYYSVFATTKMRPDPFNWSTPKISGADFYFSASEWNDFLESINTLRTEYKGLDYFNFLLAYPGDDFTSTMFNQAILRILDMNPTSSPPSIKQRGDDIYAWFFESLKSALNSIE